MATAKEIAANKKRKAKIAAQKVAEQAKFKKAKAAEKAKADKVKAAEKAKLAKAKEKLKAEKLKAKEAKAKQKEADKAAKALAKIEAAKPVVLTEQQNDQATIVNANQKIIVESGNSMIGTCIESGKILLELKEAVLAKNPTGWTPWVEINLELSIRQSQRYMQMAGDPKEVQKILIALGEADEVATIKGVCNKLSVLKLTDDAVAEREAKKTKAADARAEAAVMDIEDDKITVAIDKCDNIEKLANLIEYAQDRIDTIKAMPAAADDEGDDDDEDGENEPDDIGDLSDIAEHVDPLT